jgi:hypothetical protein
MERKKKGNPKEIRGRNDLGKSREVGYIGKRGEEER